MKLSCVTDAPYVAQVIEKKCRNDSGVPCKSFGSHLFFAEIKGDCYFERELSQLSYICFLQKYLADTNSNSKLSDLNFGPCFWKL